MENNLPEQKFYYKIGEIASHLNVNYSLLRFWEKEFDKFIKPHRSNSGTRSYTKQDFEYFIQIHSLVKVEGMTLKGAKTKLNNEKKGFKEKAEVMQTLIKLKEFLQSIKKNLK